MTDFIGTSGNDSLVGTANDDLLSGLEGEDFLRGRNGNDTLLGGADNDFLQGGEGDDVMDGGDGFDRVSMFLALPTDAQVGATVDLAIAGPQDTGHGMDTFISIEHVSGTTFADTFHGNAGANWLWGGIGNDILDGRDGDDLLEIGTGQSTVIGGSGTDTLSFFNNNDFVGGVIASLLLQGAAQTINGTSTVNASGIENLSGSSFDDTLTGDGGNNVLGGRAGNDTLNGGDGDDVLLGDGGTTMFSLLGGSGPIVQSDDFAVLYASTTDYNGNDILNGGAGNDRLVGGGGDDLLEGGIGNDIISGGAGVDTASYENSPNSIGVLVNLTSGTTNGDAGNDTLTGIENVIGSTVSDTLIGDAGANVLTGLGGDDSLIGNDGDDTLIGGAGEDFLRGRNGNDTLLGGADNDFLQGGEGDDVMDGGDGFDRVSMFLALPTDAQVGATVDLAIAGPQDTGHGMDTFISIEHVSGTTLADTFHGDAGANWLWGNIGNDTLDGRDGDDLLEIGTGQSTVIGGSGNDTLSFFNSNDFVGGVIASLLLQGAAQTINGASTVNASGIENLSGSSSDDTLTGNGGNNVLGGRAGNDTLNGGDGDDVLLGDGGTTMFSQQGGSGPIVQSDDFAVLYDNATDYNGNDILNGGAGNDRLVGGSGDDILTGGIGNDIISGGAGVDTASYEDSPNNIGVRVDLSIGTTNGDAGNDTITGVENVIGSTVSDTLIGDASANVLTGLGGDDLLIGNDGDDTLIGLEGEDFLRGRNGNDTLLGGADNDFLQGGEGDDVMDGGDGFDRVSMFLALPTDAQIGATVDLAISGPQDTGHGLDTFISIEHVSGTTLADTFHGDAGANWLWGTGGNDSLDGRDGDDLLEIGAGQSTVIGGSGTDTLSFFNNNDFVGGVIASLLLQGAAQTVNGTSTVNASGIENLSGSNFNDTLTGDGESNVLAGAAGNDTLNGGDGDDLLLGDGQIRMVSSQGGSGPITQIEDIAVYFSNPASSGNDTLNGGDGDDTLIGGGGDDLLEGGIGNDIITGGVGVDTASYETAPNEIGVYVNLTLGTTSGDAGNDTLTGIENVIGSTLSDTLIGDAGSNVLTGLAGDDSLVGDDGNDTLTGGDGDDLLEGGIGNDIISGGAGIDTASYENSPNDIGVLVNLTSGTTNGDAGNDTITGVENVIGSTVSDTLIGDAGDNELTGLGGDDLLIGNDGDDTLIGLEGEDFLRGRNGNDTLLGGADNDFLQGGEGDDVMDGGDGFDRVSMFLALPTDAQVGATVDLAIAGLQDTGHGMDSFISIEHVSGTTLADTFHGDAGSNWLWGTGGNDSLDGRDGDDLLEIGAGQSTVIGGSGTDTLSFFNNNDFVGGVIASLLLQGAAQTINGTSTVNASGIENLSGSTHNDTLTGDGGSNVLAGAAGNDTLNGGDGDDVLLGDGGTTMFSQQGGSGPIVQSDDFAVLYDNATDYNGNDILNGGAGNDRLVGGGGNDVMNGGDGIDTADYSAAGAGVTVNLASVTIQNTGGAGRDTLAEIENLLGSGFRDYFTGSSGNNVLSDTLGGDDRFFGGAGNDTLSVERSGDGVATTITLNGGIGDDAMTFDGHDRYTDTLVFEGLDGNDVVTTAGALRSTINTGTGIDTVTVDTLGGSWAVTLGSGSDTLVLAGTDGAFVGNSLNVVRDFTAGNGGDVLDLTAWLAGGALTNHTPGSSPFLTGHMRLVQTGDATLLQVDRDGGGDSFVTLMALQKTVAASFTAYNFNGLAPRPGPVEGTAGPDTLVGTAGVDVLNGNNGDDTLSGLAGGDVLNGGSGNDLLDGGDGDDVLNGGSGGLGDTVTYATASAGVRVSLSIVGPQSTGGSGSDSLTGIEHLIGSAFTDELRGDGFANRLTDTLGGNDFLRGEGGDDTLLVTRSGGGAATTIRQTGGDGADTLTFAGNGRFSDTVTLDGGVGNDLITVSGAGVVAISAGTGDDTVIFDTLGGIHRMTLGTGVDTVRLAGTGGLFQASADNLVRDFTTGAGGDIVDLTAYLAGGALTNYTGGDNPFADGHMRLVQSGTRTLLQVDRDGGGDGYQTVLTFTATTVASFTTANFNGIDPTGAVPMPVEYSEKDADAGPVLPGLEDDAFLVLPVGPGEDGPQVLPGVSDDGLPLKAGLFDFLRTAPFALAIGEDGVVSNGPEHRDNGQDGWLF